MTKVAGVLFAFLGCALAACGGQAGGPVGQPAGQSGGMALPAFDKDLAISTLLPAHAIGEELPSEGVGSVRSREWKAMIGGFTQSQYAQTLAFPPGTKITIHNLSKTTAHTFDVVKVISGPPATFPRHPALSFSARGGDHLKAG